MNPTLYMVENNLKLTPFYSTSLHAHTYMYIYMCVYVNFFLTRLTCVMYVPMRSQGMGHVITILLLYSLRSCWDYIYSDIPSLDFTDRSFSFGLVRVK